MHLTEISDIHIVRRMLGLLLNNEVQGRKRSWPNCTYSSEIFCRTEEDKVVVVVVVVIIIIIIIIIIIM